MKLFTLFASSIACLVLVASQQCPPDRPILCNLIWCIKPEWRCDGANDCGDWSDEPPNVSPEDCPPCDPEGQWRCPNGLCLSEKLACDGVDHCGDMNDEPEDPTLCPPCEYDEMRCDNGECIRDGYACNGTPNCRDEREDPADCWPCREVQFRCGTGHCILKDYVCDGVNDCNDWSDENEESCPCATDENRCNAVTPPPGESTVPGACMPSVFWCDEDGIWDCPDGSDERNCSRDRNRDVKEVENVREIRKKFHKSALKATRKQQKKTR